jgi:hypothetical protein
MNAVKVVKGDKAVLKYQVKEDGVPKNITGMTFKFAAKQNLDDAAYAISPVNGAIEDAANGKFSFILDSTATATVFTGLFEICMYDGSNNKTALTPAGGVAIKVVENIID